VASLSSMKPPQAHAGGVSTLRIPQVEQVFLAVQGGFGKEVGTEGFEPPTPSV
jgi:hypothetical protein